MKNTFRKFRSFVFVAILFLLALCFSMLAKAAGPYSLINNVGNTNSVTLMNGVTNINGVVQATTTNAYNWQVGSTASGGSYLMSGSTAVSTNLWPSAGINLWPGYPNTLYGAAKTIDLSAQFNLMATNQGTPTRTFYFSGSIDGTNICATNYFVWPCVVGANVTGFNGSTNFTCPYPFLILTWDLNTNSVACSNTVLKFACYPGL